MKPFKKHPVLLIGYSRHLHIAKVLSKIKNYFPDDLYIFIDGLDEKSNKETLSGHRKVVDLVGQFEGAKNVHIKLSDKNLGCGLGPSAAISWVLSSENDVIILEDDVLPTLDFFEYMNVNLSRLSDSDCMMISSNKYDRFPQFGNSIKTRFTLTNGWATWKRAWDLYNYRLVSFDVDNLLDANVTFIVNKAVWRKIASEVQSNKNISYWDYQWQFSVWKHNGWSLQPPRNLTRNIGFDKYGTHTTGSDWRETILAPEEGPKIKPGYKEIGIVHDLMISIYKSYIPSYIYRLLKIKI